MRAPITFEEFVLYFPTLSSVPGTQINENRLGGQAMPETPAIRSRIKHLLVDALHLQGLSPANIVDDAPLFGAGLGLDSVDALELVVAIEKEFGIRIQNHEVGEEAFASVSALAAFVDGRLAAAGNPNAGT